MIVGMRGLTNLRVAARVMSMRLIVHGGDEQTNVEDSSSSTKSSDVPKRHEGGLKDVAEYVATRSSLSMSESYQLLVDRFRPSSDYKFPNTVEKLEYKLV